ncbi:hypothetical protein [Nocardioides sp. LHG3406-4]|uniref:hypothetical protein n=1 Tax=Nocardioides sp. LHG3406-4 TaxID=2804575 RepID=UPI003CED6EA6
MSVEMRVRSTTSERQDERVRPKQQRDEKTVVIASAVGLFCLVLVIGLAGLWAANYLLDLNDSVTNPLVNAFVIAAGVALVVYLIRARRR